MAKSKNVTIRELKAAAKARGWPVEVGIYRSPGRDVIWAVNVVAYDVRYNEQISVRAHSRQGAMRMALAALRAK